MEKEVYPCSSVGGTTLRLMCGSAKERLVDRGQRVYKAATENHIKFEIKFPALISKEK